MPVTIFRKLTTDPLFWLAQSLAVLFWLYLYLTGSPSNSLQWLEDNWLLFLQLALFYPVLEEIVFRGLLQGRLWESRFGRYVAMSLSLPNLITSVIFTALHFLYHPPLWAVGVFIPSLVFGFFRDRYQHLAPAIYLHIFFNGGYFLLFGN